MFTSGFYELWANYNGGFCKADANDDNRNPHDCVKQTSNIFSIINRNHHDDHHHVDTTLNMGTAFLMIVLL